MRSRKPTMSKLKLKTAVKKGMANYSSSTKRRPRSRRNLNLLDDEREFEGVPV